MRKLIVFGSILLSKLIIPFYICISVLLKFIMKMNKFIGCILLGGCLLAVLPLWATETDELGIIKKNYRNILMLSAGKADSLQADFIRIKPETEMSDQMLV